MSAKNTGIEVRNSSRTPSRFLPGLSALAQGLPADTGYVVIPVYRQGATPAEQTAWLNSLEEHERALYDPARIKFQLEFTGNTGRYPGTAYDVALGMDEMLHEAIVRDLEDNLGYRSREPFDIQSLEFRDAYEGIARILVAVELSYPLDVSHIRPHGMACAWRVDEDDAY